MNPNHLKELDLLPVWTLKTTAATAADVATPATPPPSSPQQSVTASPQSTVNHAAIATTTPEQKPATTPAPVITTLPDSIKKMDWQTLRNTVAQCRACPLCEQRKQTAFGDGNQQADLFLVGEGPGQEEDRQGIPFVGAAGKLLDEMLFAIGHSRKHNTYIANIVKCRPPQNRNPENTEARTCLPYLARQIQLAQPRLIVALGRVAATHLLNTDSAIGALRQKLHDYQSIPVIVTYHPAYLLRSPQEKRKSWDDLTFIQKILGD